MTQFLLTRPEPGRLQPGFIARAVASTSPLAEAAAAIFAEPAGIWQILTPHDELDRACDAARASLLTGATLDRTALGETLLSLASGEFALFWANDYAELPAPATIAELLQLVTEQLRSQDGNWEIYARWRRR